jgi:hypothetical protein
VSENGFFLPNACSNFWARIAVFGAVSGEFDGFVLAEMGLVDISRSGMT